MLNSCQISKYTLKFCRNDEKYTRNRNGLLKDDYETAFSQQLIIVSQNIKFGPNMGLNVPTPFIIEWLHIGPVHIRLNLVQINLIRINLSQYKCNLLSSH